MVYDPFSNDPADVRQHLNRRSRALFIRLRESSARASAKTAAASSGAAALPNGGSATAVAQATAPPLVAQVTAPPPAPALAAPVSRLGTATTLFGTTVTVDDRVRAVAEFISKNVNSPGVEIEGKLGVLIEKHENRRAVALVPVACETPLLPIANHDVRFQSCVPEAVFAALNTALNGRVTRASRRSSNTAAAADPSTPTVTYARVKGMDVSYASRVRQTLAPSPGGGPPVVVRTERKVRIGDLNVLCPGWPVDFRFSASLEEPVAEPPSPSTIRSRREKDRLSYKAGCLSVDITTVLMTEGSSPNGPETMSQEVEVEIDGTVVDLYAEVQAYREARGRVGEGGERLLEIAAELVATLRALAAVAAEAMAT